MNQYSLLAKLFPKLKSGGKVLLEVALLLVGLILVLKNHRQGGNMGGLLLPLAVAGLGAWLLGKRLMEEKRRKSKKNKS